MHRAPEEPWTVATLAREAGMSRSAFAASFKSVVGESALRYLTRWRMELARSLLDGDLSVSEVAERVGYASDAAFCRAFKRELGTTPTSVSRGS